VELRPKPLIHPLKLDKNVVVLATLSPQILQLVEVVNVQTRHASPYTEMSHRSMVVVRVVGDSEGGGGKTNLDWRVLNNPRINSTPLNLNGVVGFLTMDNIAVTTRRVPPSVGVERSDNTRVGITRTSSRAPVSMTH
jgi:phosphoribosylanthranilate isomerase